LKIKIKNKKYIFFETLRLVSITRVYNMSIDYAGSIDGPGYIQSLSSKGFTNVMSGSELIANSIDANSSTIIWSVDSRENCIKLIDDGHGMTRAKLIKMVNLHGEKHRTDKSMGIYGLGFTAASLQFSKSSDTTPKKVYVYTKNQNDNYLKMCVPWDEICEERVFAGRVIIGPMSDEEINNFNLERNVNRMRLTGTTIVVPYAEDIEVLLDEQFEKNPDPNNLKDSWSIIFGKTNQCIMYHNRSKRCELSKYDYFDDLDETFYGGKFRTTIYSFNDKGINRFVCKDPSHNGKTLIQPYLEFEKSGKGFSQTVSNVSIHDRIIENADVIYFVSGMRNCSKIFDIDNPKDLNASYTMNEYDHQFMKKNDTKQKKGKQKKGEQKKGDSDAQDFFGEISIYRNNQRVTGMKWSNVNDKMLKSSIRADGWSMAKALYHRASVSYEVESKQCNRIDNIHGIQVTKTQNQQIFPHNYTRLVGHLKQYHFKKIQHHMKSLINSQDDEPIFIDDDEPIFIDDDEDASDRLNEIGQDASDRLNEIGQDDSDRLNEIGEDDSDRLNEIGHDDSDRLNEIGQDDSDRLNEIGQDDSDKLNKIEESRRYLRDAAQLIMEIASDPNYSGMNGNEIYNLISRALNK